MSDRRSETEHEHPGTGPYDHARWEESDEDVGQPEPESGEPDDIDHARENVLEDWPVSSEDGGSASESPEPEPEQEPEPFAVAAAADGQVTPVEEEEGVRVEEPAPAEDGVIPAAAVAGAAAVDDVDAPEEPEEEAAPAQVEDEPVEAPTEHSPGAFVVPPGYAVLEGEASGSRRAVGVVVSRFNGDVTTRLLENALAELEQCGVSGDAITVMPVPGAFELPLAAMALAKTRRFSCVVALGCVIRGDTAHFEYVAGEAASGLQLAALETGVPVAFGLLTLEHAEQAEERIDKGAEAVRTALEMADLFANLRTAAAQ